MEISSSDYKQLRQWQQGVTTFTALVRAREGMAGIVAAFSITQGSGVPLTLEIALQTFADENAALASIEEHLSAFFGKSRALQVNE